MATPSRRTNVVAIARRLKVRPQPRRLRGRVITTSGAYATVEVAGVPRRRVRVPAHLLPAEGDSCWVEYHAGTWTMLSVTTGGAGGAGLMSLSDPAVAGGLTLLEGPRLPDEGAPR